mmetsp:Transcript_40871/g.83625  ORF Transcript_40871/g.83625 Transcript_40871/m.83625 type:complete len:195 (+) Transcript_40871:391-975(+)
MAFSTSLYDTAGVLPLGPRPKSSSHSGLTTFKATSFPVEIWIPLWTVANEPCPSNDPVLYSDRWHIGTLERWTLSEEEVRPGEDLSEDRSGEWESVLLRRPSTKRDIPNQLCKIQSSARLSHTAASPRLEEEKRCPSLQAFLPPRGEVSTALVQDTCLRGLYQHFVVPNMLKKILRCTAARRTAALPNVTGESC